MTEYINLDEPCLDAGFGYENGDGYVRILDKPRQHGGRLVMRHRWFFEVAFGPIPKGYEINHLCKNRRCCNVNHLEQLLTTEHRSKDNAERYESEFAYFRDWYLNEKNEHMSQNLMGSMFSRSQAGISIWIKRIRNG